MEIQTIKGKIEQKDLIAKNSYSIKISNVDGSEFAFKPGQFVTINVGNNVIRSYSIASTPGKNYIELIADTVRGGPGSQFFLNCKVGDEVEFLFPLGNFFYKESEKPVYFFCTGTGIVPFMSMIEYALTILNTQRQIILYSGFRFQEDIVGDGLLKMLDIRFENFRYMINLTQPPEGYEGPVGRITQYIDELKETDIEVYICGSNQMVLDVKEKLVAKGVPAEQIYHEMFY